MSGSGPRLLEAIAAYDKLIQSIHGIIHVLKPYPKILTRPEAQFLHPLFDRALFNALTLLDLTTALKYLETSGRLRNEFEKNFFGRVVAVSLYAIFEKAGHLSGREVLREVTSRLGASAADDLSRNTRALKRLSDQHWLHIRDIRCNLIGHRFPSGIQQAERILEIDARMLFKVGAEVRDVQLEILTCYAKLIGAL